MSTKKLAVGDKLLVKRDGEIHNATIKRIGEVHHGNGGYTTGGGWAMLTLDVHGAVAYAVARNDELADGS
jgi:hypothetical protein